MEAIGDITASAEVSRVEVEGEDFESRIQGGVLVSLILVSHGRVSNIGIVQSDGLGGFFSALFTVTPLSIFAQVCLFSPGGICKVLNKSHDQNNGVIAITRCANRGAGRWCCFFLILFGVLGKVSGVFLASGSILARHTMIDLSSPKFPTRFLVE